MMRIDPRIHDGLPAILTRTREGEVRRQLASPSTLSFEDLSAIGRVRDRLLELYFPPSHRRSFARVPYGISEGGGIWTVTAGEMSEFRIGDETVRKTRPRLMVGDEFRGTKYDSGWRTSLRLWMRHLTGGDAIFSNWSDEETLPCILLDIDVADAGMHDHLETVIGPWADAIATIERDAEVDLHVEYMISGGKGFWVQVFLQHPVSRQTGAEFALTLAAIVAGRGHRVFAKPTVRKLTPDPEAWSEPFCHEQMARFTLDLGNLASKNCRLPFAAHQTSGRFSEFVDGQGGPYEDQVGHLMGIQRTEADIAEVVSICIPGDVVLELGRSRNRRLFEVLLQEEGVPDPSGSLIDRLSTKVTASPKTPSEPLLAPPGDGSDAPEMDSDTKVTPEQPSRRSQSVTRLSSLMGEQDCHVTLDDLIPPLHHGYTNETLVYGKALDQLYAWFRLNRGAFTVEDILDALRPHYADRDKTHEVRKVVKRDFRNGRHLTANPDGWTHPCVHVCEGVADDIGLDRSSQEFGVLVYLAYKGWRAGVATVTSLEIGRSLELISDDEADALRIGSVKQSIGRSLKRLRKTGLIRRTVVGHQGGYSEYLILFPLRDGQPLPMSRDERELIEELSWGWIVRRGDVRSTA